MITCVYATKIGDVLLEDENGNLLSIYPNTFYNPGSTGYWMLRLIGYRYSIIKVFFKPRALFNTRDADFEK